MKKLIPALCLLLVTAVLMGTSTFAWFTMNTTVTATGMQVKAQASGGLLIAAYNAGGGTEDERFPSGFSASASATITGVTTLSPVSTTDLTNWFTGIADKVEEYKIKDSDSYSVVSAPGTGYYLVNSFAIKTAGGFDDFSSDLVISGVTVSSSTSKSTDLNKALRVAIEITEDGVSTTTTKKFFAPFHNSTETNNADKWDAVKAASGTVTDKIKQVDGYALLTGSNTVKIWEKVPDLSIVKVYVYYEGEDEDCKTNNTVNGVDTLTVTVSFKSVPQQPTVSVSKDGGKMKVSVDNVPYGQTPTYQWQSSDTLDGTYTDVSGATADQVAGVHTKFYKCIVTIGTNTYVNTIGVQYNA